MTSTAAIEGGRAARVAKAQRLRRQGLVVREIAEQMGVAHKTADTWLNDPDLSKQRARRDSYRGTCERCGGPTDGSHGRDRAPELCSSCREWDEEAIIAAMQAWAAEHGGVPPMTKDWRAASIDHPAARTVNRRLGWNNALLRAGFQPRHDRRPRTRDWIVEQLQAGVPVREIADALGVGTGCIHYRMRSHGVTVSEVRAGARPEASYRNPWPSSSASLRRDPRPGPADHQPSRPGSSTAPLPSPSKAR
jgi:hypothetical protein